MHCRGVGNDANGTSNFSVDLFPHFLHYDPRPFAIYWFIGYALFLGGIILFIVPPVGGHKFTQETKTKTHIKTISHGEDCKGGNSCSSFYSFSAIIGGKSNYFKVSNRRYCKFK